MPATRFSVASLAPIAYNVVIITFAVVLAPIIGIKALAFAVVLGSLAHLAVQLPAIIRMPGFRYRWCRRAHDPAAREAFLLMAPRALGLGVTQDHLPRQRQPRASTLRTGSIVAYDVAFTIVQIPLGVIGVPLGVVLLPSMSRALALGDRSQYAKLIVRSLRLLLYAMLFLTAMTIVLREQVVTLLFDYGNFSASAVQQTAQTLLFFAIGLAGHAMIVVLARAFYADEDTRTPVAAMLSVVVNVTVSVVLVDSLGLAGLALGIALGAWFEATLLAALLWRRTRASAAAGSSEPRPCSPSGLPSPAAWRSSSSTARGWSSVRRSATRSCWCCSRRSSPSGLPDSPTSPTASSSGCPNSARRRPSPLPRCVGAARRMSAGVDPETAQMSADPGPAVQLADDTAAWDAFVASAPSGSYMQLTAWAEVKAVNGWRSTRLVLDGPGGPIGAQVLVHDLGRTPWSVGYAPRGPVAPGFTQAGLAAWTAAIRGLAAHRRLSHVTIEPQVPAGEGLEAMLEACGWRRARTVQDPRTRIIGLDRPEAEVWGDLRSKWRQYVNKARRDGVVIVETGEEGIPDFHRIRSPTAPPPSSSRHPWPGSPCPSSSSPRRDPRSRSRPRGLPTSRAVALGVVGVTGTDGKTTTSYLIRAILEASGRPTGLAGTVDVIVGGEARGNPARTTTPEAPELQALLASMVAAGDGWAVIEASSHGLAQDRVGDVAWDVGVLTNLTDEHLEFHRTTRPTSGEAPALRGARGRAREPREGIRQDRRPEPRRCRRGRSSRPRPGWPVRPSSATARSAGAAVRLTGARQDAHRLHCRGPSRRAGTASWPSAWPAASTPRTRSPRWP